MTSGALESEFAKLVARVTELEASRCTHVFCKGCETDREAREKVSLRRRSSLASRLSAREVLAMPNASELLNTMHEEHELRPLVSSATSHTEQDQILAHLKPDKRFRVDLYCCRELPSWEEVVFQGGSGGTESRTFALFGFRCKPKVEALDRFHAAGVVLDIDGFANRKQINSRGIFTTVELNLWRDVDPAFREVVDLEMSRRTLSHAEAYELEVLRLPRRALPRRAIASEA